MKHNHQTQPRIHLLLWRSVSSGKGTFVLLFVLIVLGLLRLWNLLGMLGPTLLFPLDDTYITLQNALILIGKRPETFIGATPFSGATSFVHTLMVAGVALVMPPELAMSMVSLLGTILYAAGLIAIGFRFSLGPIVSAAITILGLTSGFTLAHVSSGLETPWVLAAIVAYLFCLLKPERHQFALPILLATMPFLRPELVVLSLIGVGYLSFVFRASPRTDLALRLGLCVGVGLLWAGLALLIGAPLIPSTISAKKYFYSGGCAPVGIRSELVVEALTAWLFANMGIVFGSIGLWRMWVGRLLLGFIAVLIAAYWWNLPDMLGFHAGRYMAPFVPLMCFGLAYLFSAGLMARTILRYVLLVTMCGYALVAGALPAITEAIYTRVYTAKRHAPTAEWFKRNSNPQSLIMVHDVGYLGYWIDNPLIDLVGLKTAEAASLHRQYTWPSCKMLRTNVIAHLVDVYRPAYLVVLDDWDRAIGITFAASQAANLTRVGGVEDGYQVYSLTYPNP